MDNAQHAVSVFNKWAKEYQEKFMDVSLYAGPLDFFCAAVSTGEPQILELACGPGNVSKYVLDKRPDFRLYGTDLSENMIELARQNNPSAEFAVMDSRAAKDLNKQFEGILISFLLPYLSYQETDELLGDCSSVLQKDGLIYVSTIEGTYESSGLQRNSKGDLVFMHYYTEEDLQYFFDKHHLTVLKKDKINSVMGNGTEVTDLVFIGKKRA